MKFKKITLKNKSKSSNQKIIFFYSQSIFLFSFIFLTVAISSLFFIIGIKITLINLLLALFFSTLATYLFGIKQGISKNLNLKFIAIGLALVISSVAINSFIYDFSWDGNTYHKTAVGMLNDGWNPIWQSAQDFSKTDQHSIIEVKEKPERNFLYENHYAKAHWIFAANLYHLTGNIESGHAINLIALIATISLIVAILVNFISLGWAFILAIIASFSPVLSTQIFTYYNDGLLGVYIVAIITSLIFLIIETPKIDQKLKLALFFIIGSVLINIKFTGLMFAGIYSLGFFFYSLINAKLRKNLALKFFFTGVALVLFSTLIIGASSYLKNTIEKHHPLYPLAGAGKVDIMINNSPKEFFQDNIPGRPFLYSLFSKSDNIFPAHNKSPQLKLPFTVDPEEFKFFAYVDTRVSGHGVLFSGIFIISIIIIISRFKIVKSNHPRLFTIYLCLLIPTILIILFIKETWWARYIPFLTALPALAIYLLLLYPYRYTKIINFIFTAIILVNIISVFGIYSARIGYQMYHSRFCQAIPLNQDYIHIQLKDISFYGTLYNIKDCTNKQKIKIIHDPSVNQEFIHRLIKVN